MSSRRQMFSNICKHLRHLQLCKVFKHFYVRYIYGEVIYKFFFVEWRQKKLVKGLQRFSEYILFISCKPLQTFFSEKLTNQIIFLIINVV